MWQRRDETEVTCIACDEHVTRPEAREYDKHGDRWDRRDKEFEHLCKPCYRELCHQPRTGLESLLDDVDAGAVSNAEFLSSYTEAVDAADSDEDTDADGEREPGPQP